MSSSKSLKEVTLISLTKRWHSGALSKSIFQREKQKDTEGVPNLPGQLIKRTSAWKINSKEL